MRKAGCEFDRQKGDHRIYKRDDLKRPIIFPADDEIPVFIIRNNLRTLSLSRSDYFKFLKDC